MRVHAILSYYRELSRCRVCGYTNQVMPKLVSQNEDVKTASMYLSAEPISWTRMNEIARHSDVRWVLPIHIACIRFGGRQVNLRIRVSAEHAQQNTQRCCRHNFQISLRTFVPAHGCNAKFVWPEVSLVGSVYVCQITIHVACARSETRHQHL